MYVLCGGKGTSESPKVPSDRQFFLPTVSDLEVFGCELDPIASDTQLPLQDPTRSTLKKHSFKWLSDSAWKKGTQSLLLSTNAPSCRGGVGDHTNGIGRVAKLPPATNCEALGRLPPGWRLSRLLCA